MRLQQEEHGHFGTIFVVQLSFDMYRTIKSFMRKQELNFLMYGENTNTMATPII